LINTFPLIFPATIITTPYSTLQEISKSIDPVTIGTAHIHYNKTSNTWQTITWQRRSGGYTNREAVRRSRSDQAAASKTPTAASISAKRGFAGSRGA
jgi:hypothetical protein